MYNLTGIITGAGNETGLLTLVQGVNTELMGGLLGAIFLIGISLVMLIAFITTTQDVGKSVAATSFIAFSFALSLMALDLMSPMGGFYTLVIAALSIATTWNRS